MSHIRRAAIHKTITSLFFAALVVGSVLSSRILTSALEDRVSAARGEVIAVLRELTAQQISWESVSPSVLRSITFYGVRLSDDATATRVSVGLNPFVILFNGPGSPVPYVEIDSPQITLTDPVAWQRLDRTIDFFAGIDARAPRITVTVSNGSIRAERSEQRVDLESLNGSLTFASSGEIRAALTTHADVTAAIDSEQFSVETDIAVELDRLRRGGALQASLDLNAIHGSHFQLDDQSFHFQATDDLFVLQRVRSDTPLDVRFDIDGQSGIATAAIQSESFTPNEMIRLRGPWAEYSPWTSLPVTTDSVAVFDLAGGLISANGSIATVVRHDEILPTPLAFQADFSADSSTVTVPSVTVWGTTGRVTGSGSYRFGDPLPNASITASGFQYADSPTVSGSVTLSSTAGGGGLFSEQFSVDAQELYNTAVEYQRLTDRHMISLSTTLNRDGTSSVTAKANIGGQDDFSGSVDLARVSAASADSLAGSFGFAVELPAAAKTAQLSASVRFDHRDGETHVRVPYVVLADTADPERIVTARGEYRNGTISVDRFFARAGVIRADGSALARIGSGGTVDFDTAFSVNGVEYSLRGLYSEETGLSIVGPYDVQVRVTRSRQGGLRVRAGALDVPLPLGDSRVSGSVDGLFLSERDWYLTIQDLVVDDVPMPAGGTGRAVLAASINDGAVEVVLLEFEDSVGSLTGTFEFDLQGSATNEIRGSGRVASLDGVEQYRFAGRVVEGALALDARFENAPLARASADVRSGTLSGAIQVVGSPTSPQVRGFFESDTVRIGNQEIRGRLRVYGDDRILQVRDAELIAASRSLEIDEITVNRTDGSITGDALIRRPQNAGTIEVKVNGTTDPIPSFDRFSLKDAPLSLAVETRTSDTIIGAARGTDVTHVYTIAKSVGRTDIRRNDGAIRGSVTDTGEFVMSFTAPLPISAQATGTLRDGEIELTASGITVNLPEITAAIPDAPIEIRSGTARGSIRVIGPVDDPDLFGTLRIQDLSMDTEFSPETVGPTDVALILEDKQIRIPRFSTSVGSAIVEADGTVLLNRWALSEYRLNLEIPGPDGVHVVSTFGPIDLDGYGRGVITLTGRPRDIAVQGDLVVSGAEIGVIPATDQPDSPEEINVNVDLTLETGRSVRFIWPAADFPIIRSNFSVGQEVALKIDSVDDTFSLIGDLEIQSGDVFYFDRNFLIREGVIAFREDEEQFDPRVSARAELREVTPDGPVRIYLVADGQRLSEFSPRFESNPPLGGTEIVAILGGNIFQQGPNEDTNLSTALLSTSDIVTQFGVFREFENEIRSRLDLDLFAIRTSVIQNLVLTAITPTDETTQQLAPTLGNYLNNTSIFMGRYIGDSVFGQAILQMRAVDFNERDQNDGIQRLGGVLIDSEISLEWQTPFFMLEWNLAPENPEELFIRDNTFTFSWSFSY